MIGGNPVLDIIEFRSCPPRAHRRESSLARRIQVRDGGFKERDRRPIDQQPVTPQGNRQNGLEEGDIDPTFPFQRKVIRYPDHVILDKQEPQTAQGIVHLFGEGLQVQGFIIARSSRIGLDIRRMAQSLEIAVLDLSRLFEL